MNFLRREKPGYNRIIKRNLTLNPLSPEWLDRKPTGKGVEFLERHGKGPEINTSLWKHTMGKGIEEKSGEVTEAPTMDLEGATQTMVYKLKKMEEEKPTASLPQPATSEDKPLPPSFSHTFGPFDASLIYEDIMVEEEAPQKTMENKVLNSIMDDLMQFAGGV